MPRPSFGCMPCRQRRVKCDERGGGCLRCQRYGIACPGYLRRMDVLLRQHGTGKTGSGADPWISSTTELADLHRKEPKQRFPPMHNAKSRPPTLWHPTYVRQPPASLEEAALGAFYASYCVSSSTLCSLGHLRQQGNGCLLAAIQTLGVMQLQRTWQLPQGSNTILQRYSDAIALLNTAISSPIESRRDSTLLATFVLSIVEMKASPDFNLYYWLAHVKGAAALIHMRGTDCVSSRLGAVLYLQFSSQLVVYCILGRQRIPYGLQSMRHEIQPLVLHDTHPLWLWHGLMYRFVDFFAAAYAVDFDGFAHRAQAILTEALSILYSMESVFVKAGRYWQYETQPSEEFSPVLDHQHIYHSLLAARIWNDRRTVTILIWTVIAETAARCTELRAFDKDSQIYIEHARKAIGNTALEVLAAVPQMLGGLKDKSLLATFSTRNQGPELCNSNSEYDERVFRELRQDWTTLPHMDSCRVQWQIYFAAKSEYVELGIRRHLFRVLDEYANSMQIQQWLILVESLRPTL